MTDFVPPTVTPPSKVLGVFESIRAMRENVLNIIPRIAYTQPIVSGTTGIIRWHMAQGPEAMRRIFLDNVQNYPKSEGMLRMLRPAVGESLFTSEGANWRWQRRAIAPVFSARNVGALAPLMTATAERASQRLQRTDRNVDIVDETMSATFDVICEVALSSGEQFDARRYLAAIERYYHTIGRASFLDFLNVPLWVPRPGELFGRRAITVAHAMVRRAIAVRRAATGREKDDLLDYMMKAEDPETGRRMTDQDLLHNMQFFIVAGHETTALAISWALLLLAHEPEIQERVRSQVRDVLEGRAARLEDLKQLSQVEAVLDETMRLYPPVGLLARSALEPDQLYDRDIRPGDTVFLNIYGLHRHKMYWESPERFDPGRFSPEAKESRDRYCYLPFGAGPRVCVGGNFAVMQAMIILSTLLGRFRFKPAGTVLPTPTMHMTVRPVPGIKLIAEPIDRTALTRSDLAAAS
jgi:cytochrome P450